MSYDVLVSDELNELLKDLDKKTTRIIKNNLKKLNKHPYPGEGKGDKEKIKWKGKKLHRLHIGRSWTAFYSINEEKKKIKVHRIMTIKKAHKEYGDI
ncbi:plasmid stabilization protein [archaeon SCG-AAA382B04]|nr:plasmid stabilization protein [archaeon SCG-AAA382B04]